MEYTISIAKDFTKSPGTGLRKEMSSDGYSGEEFREQLLLPKLLERHDPLVIDFDGVAGYHPSFFDGSFIELANIIGANTCISLLANKQLVFKTEEFKEDIKYIRIRWVEKADEEITCLIDDCRNLGCDFVIRSGESAMKILPLLKDKINILYLDYDLELGLSGLDVITRLNIQKCLPNIIQIVSSHPGGVEMIKEFLRDHKFKPISKRTFFRRKNNENA